MHYPQCKIERNFDKIHPAEFISKLKYKFTVIHNKEIIEGDIYLLQLTNRNDKVNVYIAKALVDDDIATFKTKEVLIYPFFDEKWHSSIDSDKLYEPGDLW